MDISNGLIETLKKVAGFLRVRNIPYCLAGGLAVSMLARPRATEDVDIIVLVEEKAHLERIVREAFRVISAGDVMHFPAASIWRIVVKDEQDASEGFVILNFIFADRDEYRMAVGNALTVELDGVDIAVAAPEDLIAVKRLAGRPIDLIDIDALQEAMNSER